MVPPPHCDPACSPADSPENPPDPAFYKGVVSRDFWPLGFFLIKLYTPGSPDSWANAVRIQDSYARSYSITKIRSAQCIHSAESLMFATISANSQPKAKKWFNPLSSDISGTDWWKKTDSWKSRKTIPIISLPKIWPWLLYI
jgi:hypothetical protein